jgi:hypothetical protein
MGRKYDRMVTIRTWLKERGCCGLCSIGMAIAQVEREHGDPTFRATKVGCSKVEGRQDCFERARAVWSDLPKEGATK